eukprot:TRINITY_DN149_c0_g1_i1.p1 TRINITY_DN149_c0_g1~~TRINITY_DN149_c0_g1_i1.p1  ORF type:complete len:856 (-),score=153.43 TRINITY_DN149_c0_g1_i1:529-3096(-)
MSRPLGRGKDIASGFPSAPVAPSHGFIPPPPNTNAPPPPVPGPRAMGAFANPPPPPRPVRAEPKMTYVRALYDYQGEEASELSFSKGAIITLLKKDDSGWWEGALGSSTGWFPPAFVEILPATFQPADAPADSQRAPPVPQPPPRRSTQSLNADVLTSEFARMKANQETTHVMNQPSTSTSTGSSLPPPPPQSASTQQEPTAPVQFNPFLAARQNAAALAGAGAKMPPVQQKFLKQTSLGSNESPSATPPASSVSIAPVPEQQLPPPPPVPARKPSLSDTLETGLQTSQANTKAFAPPPPPPAASEAFNTVSPTTKAFSPPAPSQKLFAGESTTSSLTKNTFERVPPRVEKASFSSPKIVTAPEPVPTRVQVQESIVPSADGLPKGGPTRAAPAPPQLLFNEKQYAQVLYDFNGESTLELNVTQGLIVQVLNREIQWVEVLHDGGSGWIPSWFIRLLPSDVPPSEIAAPVPEPPKEENLLERVSVETKRLEVPGRARMTGKRPPTRKTRGEKTESTDFMGLAEPSPVSEPKAEAEVTPQNDSAPAVASAPEPVGETLYASASEPTPPPPEPESVPVARPTANITAGVALPGANLNELTAALRKRSESNSTAALSIEEKIANRSTRTMTVEKAPEPAGASSARAMFQAQSSVAKPVEKAAFPTSSIARNNLPSAPKPLAPSGPSAVTPKPMFPGATSKPLAPSGPSGLSRTVGASSDRSVAAVPEPSPSVSSTEVSDQTPKEPIANRFQQNLGRSVGSTMGGSGAVKPSNPMEEMRAKLALRRSEATSPTVPAPPPPTNPNLYTATHDYQAQSATELTLRTGDDVIINTRDPSGWWEGESGGRRGWFPEGFVKPKV